MSQASRYGLVVLVIAVGVIVARPYRRQISKTLPPTEREEIVLHEPQPVEAGRPESKPIESPTPVLPSSSAAPHPAELGEPSSNAEPTSPVPHSNAAPVTLPAIRPIEMHRGERDRQASAEAGRSARPPGQKTRPKRRRRLKTHRIVDGDSLHALAEKYLGRSERHLEIFELNRDILARPDILPLGREILIPVEVAGN
jgi:nucleoid-associated protein YgaU